MTWLALLIAFAVVGTIASIAWHLSKSASLLQRWADDNGFRILRSEYRNFVRGPYFWTTTRGQTGYRVSVEDKAGTVRGGWVRCGSWWLGLLSDRVEVRWVDPRPPTADLMRDRWLDV